MVRTREQARRRPQEPAVNAGRRRFAPPQFLDVPSASEGSQPSHHDPRRQEEGAGASTQPFQQPNSPLSVQRPSDPQPAASPVQRRPSTEQPRRSSSRQQASSSFHSMPTVDSSQSMPDYEHSPSTHSAHPTQPNEVNSFPMTLMPLLTYHPVHGFLGSGFHDEGSSMPPPQPSHASSTSFDGMQHASEPFAEDSAESSMPRAMSNPPERYRRGRTYSVPSEEALHGYLQFFDNEEATRFVDIRHRKFQVCKFIDDATLNTLHLTESAKGYFAAIGWVPYSEIRCNTYYELVFEFYTTFTFSQQRVISVDSPNVVSFWLLGLYFRLSISEFNFFMGFVTDVTDSSYLNAVLEIPQDFDADLAYESLTGLVGVSYDSRSTKGWKVYEPALRYIHRFLAYSFSGRNDTSSNLNKVELFFLWCMQHGLKVNLGFWFARAFAQVVRNNRPLILGPYITHLASRLFPLTFDANQFTYAFSMDPLDVRCLDSMGLLAGTSDAPFIIPPGIPTLRNERVYRRGTPSQPPPEEHPQPNVNSEMHEVQGRLNSIETNIAEILSYLRPGTTSFPSLVLYFYILRQNGLSVGGRFMSNSILPI
ncbi:hypothetical protein GQ457_16G002080 [Hibiscus cannabinus]